MENIDDPLTDSQKPSTNTTLPPPPTSQLHPNPGPAKAGSNTSSYRAPRASWRQQGLITQPETGKPGSDCLSSPLDTGKTTRCKTLSICCDRLLRVCDCSLLLSVVGSKCCVTSSPLYLPAL